MEYLNGLKMILRSPLVRQLIFLISLAGSVALGIVIYMTIQEPNYRKLDYQITNQNISKVIGVLDKENIPYKLTKDGSTLLVPEASMRTAEIKLSSAGVPKDGDFSYSFLNEKNSFSSNQFIESARFTRALEADLSKTISGIDGVISAKVHIAVPQNNIFVDEANKPTASVVLAITPAIAFDREKIRAIVQIIASSVSGLDPKDVAITDQYGHYLSSRLDENSILNEEELSFQNEVQKYYETRIESLITPLIGVDKVHIRVYANIDFTQQEEAKEQYNPDQKVIRSEQSVTEQAGSSTASGVPGSLSASPPAEDSKGKPEAQTGSSQGRSESVKNYEVGKSLLYTKSSHAQIKNLSVAVVVDNVDVVDPKTKKITSKAVDQDKINKITQLIKSTIGFSKERGDGVTVINSSFIPVEEVKAIELPIWKQSWFWEDAKKMSSILVLFTFLLLFYRRVARFTKDKINIIDGSSVVRDSNAESVEVQKLKQDQINRLKEIAMRDPNRVSSVIKGWVGKP